MKRSFNFFILSFLIMAFLAAGCSKKDDNPSAPQQIANTPPAIPEVTIKGPASASNDPMLQLVKDYFTGLNPFMNYSNMFRNVPAALEDSTWVRRYLNGSITATLTAKRLDDGSYVWRLTFSGTNDTVTYNNWLALEGTSSADGKTGTWKAYRYNTNMMQGDYSWRRNDDGSITAVVRQYRNGNVYSRFEFLENSDHSGQVLVYFSGNLAFKASWQTNGSGQWWMYDSFGNIRHQGNWS